MSKFKFLPIVFPVLLFFINSCGVSNEEKERVAAVTCSVIEESIMLDASFRVEKINDAREKLKLPPFLDGDDEIQRSVKFDTCKMLVLNDENYTKKTDMLEIDFNIELKRLAKEKAEREAEAERNRLEKLAEAERIRKERLMAEYEEKKDEISKKADDICFNVKYSEAMWLVNSILGGNEASEEKKQKVLIKPLLDEGASEVIAKEIISAIDIWHVLNTKKEEESLKGKMLNCMYDALPKECSSIPKIALEQKYFPERLDELIKIQEAADECSYYP